MLFRCHLACQIKHAGLMCHITNVRWHTLYLQINSTGCIEKKLTYPLSKNIFRDVNFLSTHPVYCSNALTYSTAENILNYSAQNILLKMFCWKCSAKNDLLKMFSSKCSTQNFLLKLLCNILRRTFWTKQIQQDLLKQIILSRTFRAKHLSLIAAEEIVNVFQ